MLHASAIPAGPPGRRAPAAAQRSVLDRLAAALASTVDSQSTVTPQQWARRAPSKLIVTSPRCQLSIRWRRDAIVVSSLDSSSTRNLDRPPHRSHRVRGNVHHLRDLDRWALARRLGDGRGDGDGDFGPAEPPSLWPRNGGCWSLAFMRQSSAGGESWLGRELTVGRRPQDPARVVARAPGQDT